ncbi:MAG: DUF2147 domain-containing protein [Pseudomonadota bacterium]
MKKILAKIALVALAATVPVTASAQAAIEGRWKNEKGSVVVRVAPCGDALCGFVVDATAKAKAGARKGGTNQLIGTRILSNLHPTGDGTFRGQAFEPKRNIHVPATVRMISPGVLSVRGCVLAGLICKEQRWTRVS